MSTNHEGFMRLAIAEAARAGAEGNSAVGSVIVQNNAVIGSGRNLVASNNDPTAHAEMIAITQASEMLQSWRLNDCVLYVTLEPCTHFGVTPPCTNIIKRKKIFPYFFSYC